MTSFDTVTPSAAPLSFLPREIQLHLHVRDREVVETLAPMDDDAIRDDYAVTALRIGVMALHRARGEVDTQRLRHEGDRLIHDVRELLVERSHEMNTSFQDVLKSYLDPRSGALPQRLERLIADDGELVSLLRAHVGGADSEIAKTLAQHVGNRSDIFKLLDPAQANSLMAQLTKALEESMRRQKEQVLKEFSLDNRDGALAKMMGELTTSQGKLRCDFQEDINRVVSQFSLDNDDSALSRLVARVDDAQRGIVQQFSLDDDTSALSRLRREMVSTIEGLSKRQQEFQGEIGQMVAALKATREAEDRSTLHGLAFEEKLRAFVAQEASRQSDLFDDVASRTGALKNCKVGDHVVTVGPDHVAAGRRIVIEAKESKSVSETEAVQELRRAKENREADVGIFVFSRKVVGDKEPFRRVGDDLFVVWDADVPATDIYVQAALSVAKALLHHKAKVPTGVAVDFSVIDTAIAEIARQTETLDKMATTTSTIRTGAEKLDAHIASVRKALDKEVGRLTTQVKHARDALTTAA